MALPLTIIVALPSEASILTSQALTQNIPIKLTQNVFLLLSGMGAENARQAAIQSINKGAAALLSFGTAAGISPDCQAGDVLLADSCLGSQQQIVPIDRAWQQNLYRLLQQTRAISLIHGSICETTQVVSCNSDKQQLFATSKATALDMESATLAQVAHQHQIPFVSLRAIVDSANMHIPNIVINAMDKHGIVNNQKLLHGLLHKPSSLLPLLSLARNFYVARKALRQCLNTTGVEFMCGANK